MLMSELLIKQDDNYMTTCFPFFADISVPKGSILILHGMAEHHGRFTEFAEFMNQHGFDVFLYDHRGHGTDKKLEELGSFAPSHGAERIIQDALHILHFIKENGRSNRCILFGHSMGALVLRNMIQREDDVFCAVISGTPHTPRFINAGGLVLSSIISFFKKHSYRSSLMDNLMFGTKLYKENESRTKFDWLTRNQSIVDKYVNDPYCGFLCTVGMYHDILSLMWNAGSASKTRLTRKDIPLYLISGEKDPVGGFGRDIYRYASQLQRLGFTDVSCTLYEECRHELLFELNSKEVCNELLHWIKNEIDSNPNMHN